LKFRTGFLKSLMGNLQIWLVIYLKVGDKSRKEYRSSTNPNTTSYSFHELQNTRILRKIASFKS
jgi:hypothetical protein